MFSKLQMQNKSLLDYITSWWHRTYSNLSANPSVGAVWLFVFVMLYVVAIQCNSLLNGFVQWDDTTLIHSNPYIRLTWSNVIENFTSIDIALTKISLSINYAISRLDPFGYHFTNLLLHLLNTFLIYRLLRWLLSGFQSQQIVSLVAALVFGIHPMHSESVAWIAARKDVLYAFFLLLSMLYYLNYLEHQSFLKYIFSFVFFLLSVLSQGLGIVLVLILPLFDYMHQRKMSIGIWADKIPFVVAVVLYLCCNWSGVAAAPHITSYFSYHDISFFHNMYYLFYAFNLYILKLLFPFYLSPVYNLPVLPTESIPYSAIIHVLLFLVFVFVLIFAFQKKYKILFFFLSFLAANLIVSMIWGNLGKYSIINDRYAYLGSLSLGVAIGFAVEKLMRLKKRYSIFYLVFLAVYVVSISVQTVYRNQIWSNSISLWTDVIEKQPCTLAFHQRAHAYMDINKNREALADLKKAQSLSPNNERVLLYLGMVSVRLSDYHNGLHYFDAAIRTNRQEAETYFQRAQLKEFYLQMHDAAKIDYNQTIQLRPMYPDAYAGRARVYHKLSQTDSAIVDYSAAIRLQPTKSEWYQLRSEMYAQKNDRVSACNDLLTAINMGNHNAARIYVTYCKKERVKKN